MPDNPFGAPSGSSSGSSAPSAAARVAAKPDIQMVRLAARILRSPNLKPKQARRVQKYFKGFYAQDIQDAAREARLQSSDVERVASLGSERPGTYDVAQAAMTPLKVLSIPGQATLGGLSEGPQGAFRGAYGKEYYSGLSTALRVAGKSEAQARQAEANLPGYIRFPTNVAIETLTDPLTYVGFGTTSLSRNAARTVTEEVGRQLGEQAAQTAAKKLFQGGIKALDPEARRIAEGFGRHVRQHANVVGGGARVWIPGTGSHIIPGTRRLTKNFAPISGGFLNKIETRTRTLARVRIAERAGEFYPGFTQDIKDNLSALQSAQTRADWRRVFATKVTRHLDEDAQRRVMNELDIGGDLSRLVPKERVAAEKLRKAEQTWFGEYVKEGVFHTPEQQVEMGRQAMLARGARKIAGSEKRAGSAAERAAKARAEAEDLQAAIGDLRQARTIGEFGPFLERQRLGPERDIRGTTYYRGVGAPPEQVVRSTGREWWDNHLFVADNPQKARLYGDDVSEVAFKPSAKILRYDSPAFQAIDDAVRRANPRIEWDLGSYRHEEAIAQAAEKAGYDAVHFRDQGVTGTIVLNQGALASERAPRSLITAKDINAERAVGRLQERAGRAEGKAAQLERVASRLGKLHERRVAALETKAAAVTPIPAKEYAPHIILTKEAEAQLGGRLSPSGRLSGFTRTRALRDVPARDIVVGVPRELRAGDKGLPRLLKRADALDPTVPSALELNAGKVFGARGAAAERDLGLVRFWNRLDVMNAQSPQKFMLNQDEWTDDVLKDIREGKLTEGGQVSHGGHTYVVKQRPVPRTFEDGGESVVAGKTLIRKEIADDYDRVVKFVEGGDEAKVFAKGTQHAMNLWKAYATTLLPFGVPFTERNIIGNYMNGYWLPGLNPFKGTFEAKRLQHVLAQSLEKTGDLTGIANAADRATLEEAIKNRVIHAGFYTEDLGTPQQFESKFGKLVFGERGKASPLSQRFAPLYYGRKLNNWAEENARLGVFTEMRRRGYDVSSSGHTVQKYLFDYADLSHMDENAKRFIPFWTWTRKNLPLQLETLVKQPGKITFQGHVFDAARQESVNYDPLALQQWMKENEAIVAPFKVGGKPFAVMPDVPFTSTYQALDPLAKIVGVIKGNPDGWKQLARSGVLAAGAGGPVTNPVAAILAAVQVAQGQEFFTQRKFAPGEKRLGIGAEGEFLLEQLAPFGPALAKIRSTVDRPTAKVLGLTGLTSAQLTSKTRRNELFRRLTELQAWLDAQKGLQVPESQFTPSSDGGSSGNPFGGGSSGRTSSSKNPFGG